MDSLVRLGDRDSNPNRLIQSQPIRRSHSRFGNALYTDKMYGKCSCCSNHELDGFQDLAELIAAERAHALDKALL